MIQQVRRILIELFFFLLSFIFITKGFYILEDTFKESFIAFNKTYLVKEILFAILIISMLLSGYIASKYKLKPVKFMQTNKQAEKIEWQKLISKKEGLFLVIIALFFYLTYQKITHLNDYSQQALFIVLIFYCPISTIIQIKQTRKK